MTDIAVVKNIQMHELGLNKYFCTENIGYVRSREHIGPDWAFTLVSKGMLSLGRLKHKHGVTRGTGIAKRKRIIVDKSVSSERTGFNEKQGGGES